ncbi:MAG TPA: hypothetical protein VGD87_18630 [Archangium sp.]
MVVRAWWVFLFFSGCVTLPRYECELHGGSPSVRVESEHFSVVSDLKPDEVKLEIRRLERLWDAFAVYFQTTPTATARLPVLMTREVTAGEFVPSSAGFVIGELEPIMVTSRNRAYAAHELVHVLASHWLPSQPRWMNEGIAEYLGDATFLDEYTIRFGRWRWDGGRVDALDTLWGWRGLSAGDDENHTRYQSAWAWMHYLSNKEEARLRQLYVELAQGRPARETFDGIFPIAEQDALRARVQAYVDAGRFSGWESKLRRDPEVSEPRPVAPWDVHLLRRRLLEITGWRDRYQEETTIAERVAPRPLPEAVLMARAMDDGVGPQQLDRLMAISSTPGFELRLERAMATDVSIFDRATQLEKLVQERPEHVRARFEFASALLWLERPEALEQARLTVALAPWSPRTRFLQISALVQARRCADALQSFTSALGLLTEARKAEAKRFDRLRKQLETCVEAPR